MGCENERLYAAKERKPIMIKEVEMSKNGITRALPSAITASVSDVSDLNTMPQRIRCWCCRTSQK